MSDLFKMFKAEKKVTVGVSVTPSIGVEMTVIDVEQKNVMLHAFRPLVYNASAREIEDYGAFKTALRELFSELRIAPQEANVHLNLPNVLFGHTFLPTTLDNESIMGALISRAEEQYLFKKNTPVVSWVELKQNNSASQRYVMYSAMQEGVVDAIKDIFADLGATLVTIENSYSNLIKALAYTGVVTDFANTPGSWNIVLVSQNSYSVFSLLKYDIIEYYEEPIAIKSFSGDEVYFAISQAASAALSKFPSDKLLVISESNDVNAEILAMQMKQPGEVIFLDCNQYAKQPLMNIDYNVLPHYAQSLTPEAIGTAISKLKGVDLDLNFMTDVQVVEKETINVMGFDLTKEALYLASVFIGVLIIGLCYLGSMAIDKYNSDLESRKSTLEQNSQTLNSELQKLKADSAKIDIFTIAKNIDKSMVDKITYYNAIGANIPAKVWLTNFYADSTGALGIAGGTNSVDDVYLFYRNIKAQMPTSDLILSKLSVDDQNGIIDIETTKNANYSFELSNPKYSMSGASINTPAPSGGMPSGDMSVPTIPALPGT